VPQESQTIERVRGDSLVFIVALTMHGEPFPWVDWSATAQVRASPNSAAVLGEFTIDHEAEGLVSGEARFTLDNPTKSGVWDVKFVHKTNGTKMTWPGAKQDRHKLDVTPGVTRVEVVEVAP